MPAFEAAALAAFVHGAAADRIAVANGDSGLLAGELARAVPAECAALRGEDRAASEISGPGPGLVVSFPEP